jgi:hypothetical protein
MEDARGAPLAEPRWSPASSICPQWGDGTGARPRRAGTRHARPHTGGAAAGVTADCSAHGQDVEPPAGACVARRRGGSWSTQHR